ncbi:sugar ABC transporter substrate-binding protein [bacterium M00.F.Ca.ET.159.01.1.1]|nr:sugar ABC transporter substrate-binding protein [bacterium M00.F.Ca.ET.230.01.1.1]TGT74275.1 sugar ABC transporter substrate-binding protein [bacterium M00.F.Ca.ET.159.01.1.1]TGT86525.1 sugar ABC transporter substrate-binding protein [bacterium M00.F.Ca.ET.157.01.1.1]
MRIFKKCLLAGLGALALLGAAQVASAQETDQVGRAAYIDGVKGKKVIFVPISQGMDLNQAWVMVWQRHAARYGFTLEVRDPNGDTNAGIRAMQGAIAEKPDLIIVQNPDVQTYARLLKQAQAAGIKVLQVNMQSATQTDSYVGNDWIEMGRLEMGELAKHCTGPNAVSHKVVWLAGVQTGAANIYMRTGIDEVLKANPELQLVSDQPADYISEKARQITETVLQQHPDLCGIMGIWDNAEVGAGAAVAAAGKQDQVTIVTNGAGAATGCESIKNGLLDVIFNFNAPTQGEIAAQQISELLQHPDRKAGSEKTIFFGPITRVDKTNATGRNCWKPEDIK